MFVKVNGAKLYFDVEGCSLVPDGSSMRKKPTLILLHGGPGFDHTGFKPAFSALSDVVQIIYLDHRGNGRSDKCDSASWNLAQWGDDVRGFCDVLGIDNPIVYGVSFGGFVAQSYATRHPDHPSGLILVSTSAKFEFSTVFEAFEEIGGKTAREAAEGYWLNPTSKSRAHYRAHCVPLYSARNADLSDTFSRAIIKDDIAIWFNGPNNEQGRMDFREELANVQCPTLVLCGERDPITPVAFSKVIADCLPRHLVQFERFANCGHGVVGDAPAHAMEVIRKFVMAAP